MLEVEDTLGCMTPGRELCALWGKGFKLSQDLVTHSCSALQSCGALLWPLGKQQGQHRANFSWNREALASGEEVVLVPQQCTAGSHQCLCWKILVVWVVHFFLEWVGLVG